MHFLCLEPRETDKSVLKLSGNFLKKFGPEISLLASGSPDFVNFPYIIFGHKCIAPKVH